MTAVGDRLTALASPSGYGRGDAEPLDLADPAAAANAVYKLPGDWWMQIIGARAQLATSATTGNRYLDVAILDGDGNARTASPLGGPQAASLTWQYYGVTPHGGYPFVQGTHSYGSVPAILIRPGWSISVRIVGAATGDQLSGVRLLVQRVPSNAISLPLP